MTRETGGIYSQQKCAICGASYKDNRIDGLVCPTHPERRATKFRAKFGSVVGRWTDDYREALATLRQFRNEASEGKFDARSYRNDSPIGFERLCEKYLTIVETNGLRPSTVRKYYSNYRNLAGVLGNIPVNHISYSVLEDMKVGFKDYRPKTVYDHFGFLKTFLNWCIDREEIPVTNLPKFPELSKRMGMRKILDKETQAQVIGELSCHSERMVYVGCLLLATYPKIRPGELRQVKEKNLDLERGWLEIPSPKEQPDPKSIKLISEHVELLKECVSGDPESYLLRFACGRRFGRDYLYDAWGDACQRLGIEGVPLYPGTKHTSATALAKEYPYKLVKEAAGINSKAMERYINIAENDIEHLYESANPLNGGKNL